MALPALAGCATVQSWYWGVEDSAPGTQPRVMASFVTERRSSYTLKRSEKLFADFVPLLRSTRYPFRAAAFLARSSNPALRNPVLGKNRVSTPTACIVRKEQPMSAAWFSRVLKRQSRPSLPCTRRRPRLAIEALEERMLMNN